MRTFPFLLFLTLIVASCNSTKTDVNNNLPAEQYLVFGKFFGHCRGDCATLYKLEGNQLLADQMERFSGWEGLQFQPDPLRVWRLQRPC